jgi:hypothetical protein
MLRYEASHILSLAGISLLILGFFTESLTRYGGTMIGVGWVLLGLAFLASLTQSKVLYGQSRSRLIRQLDDVRRSVGLDDAILPESLEFLEASAQHWERIEHSLQSRFWVGEQDLRARVYSAAHSAMENILVLECGSSAETGMTDEQADRAIAEAVNNLRNLADRVDATANAITTYPREDFESNGVEPEGVVPEFGFLEETLAKLGQ